MYHPSSPQNVSNGHHDSNHSKSRELDSPSSEHAAAGPSSVMNGYSQNSYIPHPHNEEIVNHLYNVGFQMGEYADTILHVHQNAYRLHAIVLSRSPYLAHLMSTSPKSGGMHTIYLPLENIPEITDQGFAVALGYLYSSVSLQSLNTSNARAVLAAGCLLGGMDDLCNIAYQACAESITVDTINEWIDFVDSLTPTDGTATPSELPRTTIFGPYAARLRNDLFHFLIVTLPTVLAAHSPPELNGASHGSGPPVTTGGPGRETLLQIFSRVPFDLFKSAIESPSFQIGSDQERFKFAKAAIDLRKRARGSGVEETVVLAFGGGNSGSAVHVTRKTRKRALFKVG
ncbi:hypothetical protein BD410DRAFT_782706 [Rickenella mellea]|uniref:BTB domain-containing protein n=1 Tax=Rickenella mellea TaxID=50990 RepID=A0A4Y7QKI2_9AGAM|nr:hypothetical protein BD410DRAFT_782706 [Rickenella mellea]